VPEIEPLQEEVSEVYPGCSAAEFDSRGKGSIAIHPPQSPPLAKCCNDQACVGAHSRMQAELCANLAKACREWFYGGSTHFLIVGNTRFAPVVAMPAATTDGALVSATTKTMAMITSPITEMLPPLPLETAGLERKSVNLDLVLL